MFSDLRLNGEKFDLGTQKLFNLKLIHRKKITGGVDGARTHDLSRDRRTL